MNQKTFSPMAIIAGVLFAIVALMELITTIQVMTWYFSFVMLLTLIYALALAFCSVMCFMQRKDTLLMIAGIALAGISFLLLIFGTFGILVFLYRFFTFLGFAAMLLLIISATNPAFSKHFDTMRRIWFVPAIAIFLGFIFALWYTGLLGILSAIFLLAAVVLLCLWLSQPSQIAQNGYQQGQEQNGYQQAQGQEQNGYQQAQGQAQGQPQAQAQYQPWDGSMSMAAHILLLIFTFGVWYFIWIYRVTRYLNRVENYPWQNPTTKLLLCLFVPFYSIYWIYKNAQRIDELAAQKGIHSDISTVCLILAIFVGIVAPMIMQDKLNTIVNAEKGGFRPTAPSYQQAAPQQAAPQQAAPQQAAPQQTSGDEAISQLRSYKELLDSGVITQEEFDAKKKQLMGL